MTSPASTLSPALRWERLQGAGRHKDIIGAIQLANTIKHNQIRGDAWPVLRRCRRSPAT